MAILLKQGNVLFDGKTSIMDLYIDQGKVWFKSNDTMQIDQTIDCSGLTILPGLIDPHVHLRDPGFTHKETIASGTRAAAAGGYTTIFTMPNLDPVPDDLDHLTVQLNTIKNHAVVHVIPHGSITKDQKGEGQLADMESMKDHVVGFSDDGVGVQSDALMQQAMEKATSLNKLIIAHCEDNTLLIPHGCVHDGNVAKRFGLPAISSASEYMQIKRDLRLSQVTGCAYHVCHVSTKESVALIRQAKHDGINVTAEVTPHHLLLNESMIYKDDGCFKMNPPLRSFDDQYALLEGLLDGTIDMIATDHAPHTYDEKSKGLYGSAMGIVGLETAFALLYTYLVKTNILTLDQLINKMSVNVAKRFMIDGGTIHHGGRGDLVIMDLTKRYRIDASSFYSMGHSTPFDGWDVYGQTMMTFVNGQLVYAKEDKSCNGN